MGCWEKRGENTYRLIVAMGMDNKGKPIVKKKTVHLGSELKTEKQKEKELSRLWHIFEADCKSGKALEEGKVTLKEFAEIWFRDYADGNLSPKTLSLYRGLLDSRIIPAIGNIKLEDVRPKVINDFYRDIAEKGVRQNTKYILRPEYRNDIHINLEAGINEHNVTTLRAGKPTIPAIAEKASVYFGKPVNKLFTVKDPEGKLAGSYMNQYHRFLSAMLTWAVNWEYIESNPCEKVKPPKVERVEAPHYDDQHVLVLLKELENEPRKFQTAIYVALFGGLRIGEITALEWSDVDFEKAALNVNKQRQYIHKLGTIERQPKTESSKQEIDVDEEVIKKLRAHKVWQDEEKLKMGDKWQEHNKIFTQENGEPMGYTTTYQWFRRFCKKIGIPALKIHSLRHTCATLMLAAHIDLASVSAQLRHANVGVTSAVYAHAIRREQRKAAKALGNWVHKALDTDEDSIGDNSGNIVKNQ